ncbi:MAG: anhydro-N-acetylmuramic acid kinase [Gammaproteobacteria bacterium]|nr:anhydro-N-acetylmuramic acid kinase [Gammaproteobacteria bacterium]
MGLYIGIMSGTSLDGLDVVVIEYSDTHSFKLIAAETFPFPNKLDHRLSELISTTNCKLLDLGQLDIELGQVIADCITILLNKNNIAASDINAIGSHGQTLFHSPDSPFPFSMQIGNGNTIAQQTNITTITDFRQRDIAAGGQGAPLVPVFHKELFADGHTDRAIVNIGGISNITLLPANSSSAILGFDSGPGNGLLNAWIQSHRNTPFDKDGIWAASGQCHDALLELLMNEAYFGISIPKSTGRELFNLTWLNNKLAQLDQPVAAADVQATLIQLTVKSIADAMARYASNVKEMYLCGGGTHNTFLISQLRKDLPDLSIQSTQVLGLHPDWVEASAFAWLAYKTLNKQSGNLTSVTGAKQSVILGATYWSNESS